MNKSILFGIGGLVIGAVLTWLITSNQYATNQNQMQEAPKASTTSVMHGQGMSMDQMMESLKGKTGDDFDKAFISGMIEHHQGAINMAQEAKVSAKHEEIKSMADDIISAQTSEINQMKQWQQQWGY